MRRLKALDALPLLEQVEKARAVPINALIPMIALARIALPTSHARLSSGLGRMNDEALALCPYAGANSICYVDKLLTAKNATMERNLRLMAELGLETEPPHAEPPAPLPE